MWYLYVAEISFYAVIIGILFAIFKIKKIEKLKTVLIILPIFMVLTIGVTFTLQEPEIKVKEAISYEIGEKTSLDKVEATYHFVDVSEKVKTEENIDFNKIGKYEVKYTVPSILGDYTKVQTVEIFDTTSPVIILEGNEVEEISYKDEYKEAGYTVSDNSNEDLNDKVVITKEEVNDKEYKLIYTVEDSSKNIGTATRIIKLIDKEPPELKLNGSEKIDIELNSKYDEKGAKATDEIDGDLTDKIEITGKVDTAKVGKYTITYKVKDNSGNEAKKTRTITVYKKEEKVDTSNKNNNNTNTNSNKNQNNNSNNSTSKSSGTIYLTFDDGPTSSITPKILDILKSRGIKATFFIINYSSANEKLVKREVNEGHTVAIHGYSHNYKEIYKSVDTYMNNIKKLQDKIKKSTGYNATITRFPGGSSNTVSRFNPGIMTKLTKKVVEKGYKYFDWNVDSNDAGGARSSEAVYNNVIKGLKKNRANVVLMHDFSGNTKTVNALNDIIDYGLANGYKFSNITKSTPMVTHRVQN